MAHQAPRRQGMKPSELRGIEEYNRKNGKTWNGQLISDMTMSHLQNARKGLENRMKPLKKSHEELTEEINNRKKATTPHKESEKER